MNAFWSNIAEHGTLFILVFCRIGSCFLIMPGFASVRIPAQVRLAVALTASLCISYSLEPSSIKNLNTSISDFASFLGSEILTGLMIGFIGRIYFAALQFLVEAGATALGYTAVSSPIDETENVTSLNILLHLTATVLFFVTDLHWDLLQGLSSSYSFLPLGQHFNIHNQIFNMRNAFSEAFLIALQVFSPLIVYSIFVNFLFGLINKITPTIPVIFISPPFVLYGGLLIVYFSATDMLISFSSYFQSWLLQG